MIDFGLCFVCSAVPRKLLASKKKNDLTLNQIANDLLSSNPTQMEIDEWFSEVTEEPSDKPHHRHHKESRQRTGPVKNARDNSFTNSSSDPFGDLSLNTESKICDGEMSGEDFSDSISVS